MSILKVDTLTTTDAANSIATERVANGTAAAWVNFNGTGTVSIRGGYNVSSITDNGTGSYTVNLTNAMPDLNFAVVGEQSYTNTSSGLSSMSLWTPSTSTVGVYTFSTSGNVLDRGIVSIAVFR